MGEEFEASEPLDTITITIIVSDPSSTQEVSGTFELILDTETKDESSDSYVEGEGHGLDDEGYGLDDEGHSLEDEGPSLEEEEAAP
uniref:Uncharacterized protein n=1 Tax=Tanacetum cinerariifolium TaxID=118510 RepID=A0A699R8A7_TANCI|nr:hypothetical protein [Tanacetum cinerariifolium]